MTEPRSDAARTEPGLLLLHGWLGRGADWAAVVDAFDSGTNALAPDLPGHGTTDGIAEVNMDNAADGMARLLDDVGLKRAVIAGYSMGGRLALHLALRHPDRVAGLVLISASAGLRAEAERAERLIADAARAAALRRDPAGFVRDWYASPLFDSLTPVQRAALVRDRLANGRPEGWARALAGLSVGAQPWHGDRLREIHVPTLVLAGAADAKFTAIARAMAAAGGFTCTIVPGAGQALLVERPHIVSSAIGDVVGTASTRIPDASTLMPDANADGG